MPNSNRSRFLSPYERRQRIEAAMRQKVSDDYPDGWTWYKLAKEMRMHGSACDRLFKVQPGEKRDMMLSSIKRLAIALEVTIGFLVDRKETK